MWGNSICWQYRSSLGCCRGWTRNLQLSTQCFGVQCKLPFQRIEDRQFLWQKHSSLGRGEWGRAPRSWRTHQTYFQCKFLSWWKLSSLECGIREITTRPWTLWCGACRSLVITRALERNRAPITCTMETSIINEQHQKVKITLLHATKKN